MILRKILRKILGAALVPAMLMGAGAPALAQALDVPAASINPVSVPAGTVEMRCAGLMLALSKRAANTDGAEDIEQMTTQAFLLLLAGATMKTQETGSDHLADEISAFELVYEQRMTENRRRSGDAIAGDPLFESDLGFCMALSQSVQSQLEQN